MVVVDVGVRPVMAGTLFVARANKQVGGCAVWLDQLIPGSSGARSQSSEAWFQEPLVIVCVKECRINDLPQITRAPGLASLLLGCSKRGKQHRRQNRNDRDDHK